MLHSSVHAKVARGMDGILVFKETGRLDLVTKSNVCDSSEDVKFTLPANEDFSKVIKEIFESKTTQKQTVFEMKSTNKDEKKKYNSVCELGKL